MHIPDGYLSPGTAGVFYGVMAPIWYAAGRRVRAIQSVRVLPTMALMSAFCFVIQMLNIPLPGGTTGHAVGAGLAAIVLTPWPAVVAVSVALVIQALLFGDGGITTIGANCFNMAFVQVFLSYYLYRIMSGSMKSISGKSWAGAISAYIGVNAAGLLAGIELGLQPSLASGPDGAPLYAPYPMSIAVPAMVAGHLVAGFAEAIITAAGVAYMLRSAPELMSIPQSSETQIPSFWRKLRSASMLLAVLVVLTPLGLLAPGTAWGEWSSDQFHEIGLGFIPEGIQKWEGFWKSAFPDYGIPGLGETSGYLASAILGVLFITLVFWIFTYLGKRQAAKDAR